MKFLAIIILSILLSEHVTAQPLKITNLTDSVYIVTTWRQLESGMFPSNSMYVLTDEGAILIDSPWDTTQIIPLMDSILLRHNTSVIFCLATHSHSDRTGGFRMFNEIGVPTYSTEMTHQLCIKNNEGIAQNTFVNDTIFEIGSVYFETFYPGPGHAPDNIVVWFPRWEILYGGCFIKSIESNNLGYTGDADLVSWAAGIEKVRKRYRKPSYIITGHQDWMSEKSLRHTLTLLKKGK